MLFKMSCAEAPLFSLAQIRAFASRSIVLKSWHDNNFVKLSSWHDKRYFQTWHSF